MVAPMIVFVSGGDVEDGSKEEFFGSFFTGAQRSCQIHEFAILEAVAWSCVGESGKTLEMGLQAI